MLLCCFLHEARNKLMSIVHQRQAPPLMQFFVPLALEMMVHVLPFCVIGPTAGS